MINFLDGDWENRWGVFHEIGHNLANDKWMYKGSQEVVNNLASFISIERLTDLQTWPIPTIESNIKQCLGAYLKKPTFTAEQKYQLLVYSTMIRNLDFNCLHTVFKEMWEDEEAEIYSPFDDGDK